MTIRNAILFALALDATQAEVEALHDAIDRVYASGDNSVSPTVVATIQTEGAAPATTQQTPASAVGNEDLDIEGLPWDERIHSSNKKKTDKGAWVARRNVPDNVRAKVKADLLAARANAAAAPIATQPAVVQPGTTSTAPLPGAGIGLPGAQLGLPGSTVQQIDPTYARLTAGVAKYLITAANPQGLIDDAWVKQVLSHFGVPDGDLQNAAHNIPACQQAIDFMLSKGLQV